MKPFEDYDPLEKVIMHTIVKEIQQEIKNYPDCFTILIGWKLHQYIRMNYNNNPFNIPITVSSNNDVSYKFYSNIDGKIIISDGKSNEI